MTLTKNVTIDVAQKDVCHQQISEILTSISKSDSKVTVTALKGGITNQLLLAEQGPLRVLIRTFGRNTSAFIDREREFAIHMQLHSLGLAAPLYCKFNNGIAYGYAPGRPADYHELSNPDVGADVAKRLAQWHACLNPQDVQIRMPHPLGNIWDVLTNWVEICPPDVLPISSNELKNELSLLKTLLAKYEVQVFGHCDLLSANILLANGDDKGRLPPAPTNLTYKNEQIFSNATFIDYEYAVPCARAFDIANHFHEWQGFDCEKQLIPSLDGEPVSQWLDNYTTTLNLMGETSSKQKIMEELKAWWGMPGFYWGVWSAIQSCSSEIDFDYTNYAENRFNEYLQWRKGWGAELM